MKADRLGVLSAALASLCCLGPVLLVLLGLGSLGVGALIGRYHWWFIAAACVLLTFAWRRYLTEATRCRASHCEMAQGRITRRVLTLASLVVAVFIGLNLYTYASQSRQPPPQMAASAGPGHVVSVVMPVEGMTCFTCELTVASSLKHLPGVQSAEAKVNNGMAYVRYDPARVSLDDLLAAINKTGYHAKPPRDR